MGRKCRLLPLVAAVLGLHLLALSVIGIRSTNKATPAMDPAPISETARALQLVKGPQQTWSAPAKGRAEDAKVAKGPSPYRPQQGKAAKVVAPLNRSGGPATSATQAQPPSTPTAATARSEQVDVGQPMGETVGLATAQTPTNSPSGTTPSAAGGAMPHQLGSANLAAGQASCAPSAQAAHALNRPPNYPSLSRQLGEEGDVLVRVWVEASGLAKDGTVLSSSGHSRLDQAGLLAALSWRYAYTACSGSVPSGWLQVPIRFRLGE